MERDAGGRVGTGAKPARSRRLAMGMMIVVAALLLGGMMPGSGGSSFAAPAGLQDGTAGEDIDCTLNAEAETADENTATTATQATPVGSPVAVGDALGQPADTATTAEVTLLVQTLAACLTDGKAETVAQLVTKRYLGAVYGGGGELSRSEYLTLAAQLPSIPVSVVSVSDVRSVDGRTASADVVTITGKQLDRGRWQIVRRPAVNLGASGDEAEAADGTQRWFVNAVTALPVDVPADAVSIEVEMKEYDLDATPEQVTGSSVVLDGRNRGKEDHELLVLRLEEGVTTDVLLRSPGPGLPDGVSFVGQVTVPAGQRDPLVLVDLDPGSYWIVCLLPDEDGTPHLALGMRARFQVRS